MEARKVRIINSNKQKQFTIQSTATTLGELKKEMTRAGIDYKGLTFYEGHMRAELKDDFAPLPEKVMWKGQEVSELSFMLTTPKDKTASGAMSRMEAYAKIKELNLQDTCLKKFGQNFTRCKTEDLVKLVEDYQPTSTKKESLKEETKAKSPKEAKTEKRVFDKETPSAVRNVLVSVVNTLGHASIMDTETYKKSLKELGEEVPVTDELSDAEIDELFDFVK